MRTFITITMLLAATLTVKLNYDPKRGYSYSITGASPEEVIDAELKVKNYIRKGKIPPLPKKEQTN